jgi:predicted AAA+ superfamily ATPase
MINRYIKPLKTKSIFLFGPRGVGKSTWLQGQYSEKEAVFFNLLKPEVYEELMLHTERFEQVVLSPQNAEKTVVIDEVQKLPKLLDVVQFLIQKYKKQFILTGSSARKLKQQGFNLLAGRAIVYKMYPLSSLEIGEAFDLKKALEWGGLPDAYLANNEEEAKEYLSSYVFTYLEKEIQQEQWVRKIEPFRKFLIIAAQMNGKIINRAKIAQEVGVDNSTIASYYEILEDTLLGFELPAYHRSVRKAQKQSPKFYFIDTGIKRAIEKTTRVPLLPQTSAFGEAFEHWVILELIKLSEYKRLDWKFYYLRTKDDVEIDLVIERPGERLLLIEIKSKNKVSESDAKALELLGDDLEPGCEKVLLSQDTLEQKFKSVRAMHWKEFMERWFTSVQRLLNPKSAE